MADNATPKEYNTVNSYMLVRDIDKLIDFLKKTFDARVTERITSEDGTPTHAEVRIGDSVVMMGHAKDPSPPTYAMQYVYVENADDTYRRALQAGAESMMKPADQFYGDRNAGVRGPCGQLWWIAQRKEEVSSEELQKRAREHYG